MQDAMKLSKILDIIASLKKLQARHSNHQDTARLMRVECKVYASGEEGE